MKPRTRTVGGRARKTLPRAFSRASATIEALEVRVLLSAGDLTSLAAFNGTNGFAPAAAVGDSHGNIFGVTSYTQNGSTVGSGVLFELPAGSSTIQDLASFGGTSTLVQGTSLIIDSAGNLFGTTSDNLFEVPAGSTTPTTLAASLGPVNAVDSGGNLYGIDGPGNVWELPKGGSTEQDDVFGTSELLQTMVLGPDGNLYGTTAHGILEMNLTTRAVTTLASFNSGTAGNTPLGLTFDSSGNIWGFCQYGGSGAAPGDGTIWELPTGTGTINLVSSFDSTTGFTPVTRPVIDNSGNLIGLTEQGGTNGDGTEFEFPTANGSASPVVNANLSGNDAGMQGSGVVAGSKTYQVPQTGNADIFEQLSGPSNNKNAQDGGIFGEPGNTPPPPPPPPSTPPPLFPGWQGLKDALKMLEDKYHFEAPPPPPTPPPPPPPPSSAPIAGSILRATALPARAGLKASDQRTAALMQIRSELSEVNSQVNATQAQINKQTGVYKLYTAETKLVTRLTSQLAAESSPALKSHLQKQLSAAESAQATDSARDTADYTAINSEMSSISSLETTITSAFASLPALTVTLTQTIVSVPSTVTPGGKATAVVSITNSGTATVGGVLEIGLGARPVGVTGMKSSLIGYVKVPIHIKAGASAPVHLSFKIPASLAAGDYLLLAQLESGSPNLTASTATFTVK